MKREYQNITPQQLIQSLASAEIFRGRITHTRRVYKQELVLITKVAPSLELFLLGYTRIIIKIKFVDLKSMFLDMKYLLKDVPQWFNSLKYIDQSNGFYEFNSNTNTRIILRPLCMREYKQADKWPVLLTRDENGK